MKERTVRVFVASSSENLDVVNTICKLLQKAKSPKIEPAPWDQGTFQLSKTYIESLELELDKAEFAILVLTPDDVASIRDEEHLIPRDNVLFELGLFMGCLGRDHCYLVHGDQYPKLPTDLLGVKTAVYSSKPKKLEDALESTCDTIAKRVAEFEHKRLDAFCARLAGAWWECIRTKRDNEISFFQVLPDQDLKAIRFVNGQHFNSKGLKIGDWDSTIVGFQEAQDEIFYGWEGRHDPTKGGDAARVQGYGYINLASSSGKYKRGRGGFMDVDPNDISTAQWKTMELRRVQKKSDIRTMTEGSRKSRETLAKSALDNW